MALLEVKNLQKSFGGTTVLKNCRIIGGEASYSGGNICQNGGSLTIENCHISDGISKQTSNGGGNIYAYGWNEENKTSLQININGGLVTEGEAYHGGNIFVRNHVGLNIGKDAVISKGYARGLGGNIMPFNGPQIVSGGKIIDGTAATGGGNINIGAATLTISGGTVSNGTSGRYGGNICATPGGKITVQLVHRGRLYLSVTDEGDGMDNGTLGNVYTRYLRTTAVTDGPEGIGLGMVLVRSVATMHGGTVLMDAPQGKGTRVTMTLAIRKAQGGSLRSPVLRVDYSGERDHALVELSESLPAALYEQN